MALLASVFLALVTTSSAQALDLMSIGKGCPDVTLSPLYHTFQKQPCQYYGFSFDDDYEELKQMKDIGCICVGSGRIWHPVHDPNAPNGDGYIIQDDFSAGMSLAQVLLTERPMNSVAVCAPTYSTSDSGLTLTLYLLGKGNERLQIASKVFTNVTDNSWLELEFPEQPPGKYLLEATNPTGSRIGLWATQGDQYKGDALVGGRTVPADFLTKIRYAGSDECVEIVPNPHERIPIQLGRSLWDSIRELGMYCSMFVGDWNNGLFPYYPDWYYEKYPDFCMLDQHGKRIEATMFDKPRGWPSIDHPQQIEGCKRFTTAQVRRLRDERIPMWIMGGEELYPTYCFPDRWADYQTNALIHFRKFCAMLYGDISKLNSSWQTNFSSFDEVEPPKTPILSIPWRDWIDFRFRAMQERFVWLYQAILSGDTSRLILTPNHGNIYHDIAATRMGMMPDLYAQVCDGFETGQIISDADPELFNLMYTDSLMSLGKVVSPNRLAYKFTNPKARGGGTSYTPEAARRYTYESLGTGAWFLGLIQWRGSLPDGEWGVKGTPAAKEIEHIFGELKKLQPYLQHMYPIKPRLGIYLSRCTWSLLGFDPLWTEIHVGLIERHVPKVFLYDDSDWAGYPAILTVNNAIISTKTASKLRHYVESGGTLIIAGRFGEKNEMLKPFDQPILGKNVVVTPLPGTNIWTAKVGNGMVVWILDTTKNGVIDALVRLVDDLEISGPTTIRAQGTTKRKREVGCAGAADMPIDLSPLKSLGQTFVSPGDLIAVRFSTPTYTSEPVGCPLEVKIRRNGPDGEVIAQKNIPSDELTDNSVHEITVSGTIPGGTPLYLEIEAPKSLPKQRLGVWALKEDWYPKGDLYIDGRRQSGDLQFWIRYAEESPSDSCVEAFTLTDGLNYAQVFVNTAPSEVSINVELKPGNTFPYQVRDVLSGINLGRQSSIIRYPITLPPYGSRVVVSMFDVTTKDTKQALIAVQKARKCWQGLAKQYATTYADAALSRAKDSQPAKFMAFATKTVCALAINASAKRSGSDLIIYAEITDSNGKAVRNADVSATIIPAFGLSVKLSPLAIGKYSGRVTRSMLPAMYDYQARQYVPLSGMVTIDIVAREKHRVGAARIQSLL